MTACGMALSPPIFCSSYQPAAVQHVGMLDMTGQFSGVIFLSYWNFSFTSFLVNYVFIFSVINLNLDVQCHACMYACSMQ